MIPEISASNLAGFIGLHEYKPQHEVLFEILCKDRSILPKIEEIQREHGRRSFKKTLNDLQRDSAIQHCIQSALRNCRENENVSDIIAETQAKAEAVIILQYPQYSDKDERSRLAKEIAGMVSKQRGIQNETAILNNYETQRNVRVTERNARMYRKDCGSYQLIGKIDGYVESQNRVVDSKERTRPWPKVPLYDEIQLRTYMILTGAAEAELVERFPDGTTRTTKYMNDVEKWKPIQDLLEKTVEKLNDILTNPEELKRIVISNTVKVDQC